jgi:hypothetical protein
LLTIKLRLLRKSAIQTRNFHELRSIRLLTNIGDDLHASLHQYQFELQLSNHSMSIIFTIASALCEICGGVMQDPQLVAADIAEQMPKDPGALRVTGLAESHGIYDADFAAQLAELFEAMGM